MTEPCSKPIGPDSLTGMIFCLEGIRNTVVLLNGPMGCKFYHSTTSQFLTVHPSLYLPVQEGGEKVPVDYNFLNDWFFRQSRVPCTYLDGYDYVYGTAEKVRAALEFIRDNVSFKLLAIVNSPGASLIGDQLKDLAAQVLPGCAVVVLESPGYSQSFEEGYDLAVRQLLLQLEPEKRDKSDRRSQAVIAPPEEGGWAYNG
ncbi:MAG: nitrogenase component 1, partial [Coriobacteriia bacterium]|nr:nitrogenase component 1 [Coriobacteriia bacterium]